MYTPEQEKLDISLSIIPNFLTNIDYNFFIQKKFLVWIMRFFITFANTKQTRCFLGVIRLTTNKRTMVPILYLLVVLAIFIWSAINPKEGYLVWLMEVFPAVIGLIFFTFIYYRFRLTTLSYFIIALLSILTFIGGHYSYSKVPLFSWIKDHFDLQRNHYDRFGHFLKGLIVIVIRELLIKTSPLSKGKWLTFIVLCISLAIGAFYEIIEWSSTKIFKSGTAVKDFLGAQGDKWDAQWDMSLLLIGSFLALLIFSKLHDSLLKKK